MLDAPAAALLIRAKGFRAGARRGGGGARNAFEPRDAAYALLGAELELQSVANVRRGNENAGTEAEREATLDIGEDANAERGDNSRRRGF